jgi:hypothetical protein
MLTLQAERIKVVSLYQTLIGYQTKGHVLNCLLIILAGLIHSPAQAQQKYGVQGVVYQLDV